MFWALTKLPHSHRSINNVFTGSGIHCFVNYFGVFLFSGSSTQLSKTAADELAHCRWRAGEIHPTQNTKVNLTFIKHFSVSTYQSWCIWINTYMVTHLHKPAVKEFHKRKNNWGSQLACWVVPYCCLIFLLCWPLFDVKAKESQCVCVCVCVCVCACACSKTPECWGAGKKCGNVLELCCIH